MRKGISKIHTHTHTHMSVIEDKFEITWLTNIKSISTQTENFLVSEGVYRGSTKSPHLFSIVMEKTRGT